MANAVSPSSPTRQHRMTVQDQSETITRPRPEAQARRSFSLPGLLDSRAPARGLPGRASVEPPHGAQPVSRRAPDHARDRRTTGPGWGGGSRRRRGGDASLRAGGFVRQRGATGSARGRALANRSRLAAFHHGAVVSFDHGGAAGIVAVLKINDQALRATSLVSAEAADAFAEAFRRGF